MFSHNFKYEIQHLVRDRWIQLLTILWIFLCVFAAWNGQRTVESRVAGINIAKAEVAAADSSARSMIQAIEEGREVDVPSWRSPIQPSVIGNYYPRVAAIPSTEMSFVSIGQSDIYAHYVKPALTDQSFALNFTELASPVQLLFGSFDLSFVIIYLLPLIVIAFTYNLLSREREQGSLKLIASQPITLLQWLLHKAGTRFLVLSAIVGLALVFVLVFNGVSFTSSGGAILQFLALTLGYMLFWFVLALLVNLVGKSSAKNALTLLVCWVVLVLLIPSVVNQLAGSFYPAPSRAQMISEMRVVNEEAGKKQDEILDEYLRNHPELAAANRDDFGFWQGYLASQEVVRQEMQPVVAQFDKQLTNQQEWVAKLRLLSPALLLQDGFNELAQTSTRHYKAFRKQIIEFAGEWRSFFVPMVFNNQKVTVQTLYRLPEFNYQPPVISRQISVNILAMVLYFIILFVASLDLYRRRTTEGLIIGEQ